MKTNTPDRLASLLAQRAYWPSESGPVEHIQTHISHVFLVGDRVFKLRKDIRLPFLDFGNREARNRDCLREIELNRRLAPTVYLGLAPLLDEKTHLRVGPVGQSLSDSDVEHLVVMRRLSAGRDALSLLEADRLGPLEVESIAFRIARFHALQGLGCPAPFSSEDWFDRTSAPIYASLISIGETEVVPAARLAEIEAQVSDQMSALAPRLEERRAEGRAVDGHGDLHLDHVWFEASEAEPVIIDCLEFNDDLRKIDRASEMAFLAMDLGYRGRTDLAEWLLASYARETDDYGLFPVVNLFAAYRALVRAKVAALAMLQPGIPESQRARARESVGRHLTLTESLLEPPPRPGLVVLCGTVGSGKSSVARHLASAGKGIPIVSDRVRKVLAGIPATTHPTSADSEGLYDPKQTERVYRALLERAACVADSGRTAILDASYARRQDRDRVRRWAAERRIPVRLMEVRCDTGNARRRLQERERAGTDPSDAGPDFLPVSEARFESPSEWPDTDRQIVWTNEPGWESTIS